jgi:hypothetical protein
MRSGRIEQRPARFVCKYSEYRNPGSNVERRHKFCHPPSMLRSEMHSVGRNLPISVAEAYAARTHLIYQLRGIFHVRAACHLSE